MSTIEKSMFEKVPDFTKRIAWFENYRMKNNMFWPNEERGDGEEILISLVPRAVSYTHLDVYKRQTLLSLKL